MFKSIISVIWTSIRFFLIHLRYGTRFSFRGIQRFSPNTGISLDRESTISMGSRVRAHSGTKIRARQNGVVRIGNDVAFNYNCIITAYERIVISDGCEIGPGVLFFDHDHDIYGHSIKEKLYRTSPIIIGKNVWIGANAVILRGAIVGDNSVIGAGTVIRGGNYPDNSIIYSNQELKIKRMDE